MAFDRPAIAGAATEAQRTEVPVVGIGASAGGLEALRELFGPAEKPTGLAFVVVQHLDPTHESLLAQLVGRSTHLTVKQIDGDEVPAADTVYIIPPGSGLAMRDGILRLVPFAQPRGLRRPIDDFLLSLATDRQAQAACVILSGTGSDGAIGLRAVKEHGGVCLVQTPDSAKYDGMPVAAISTGLVDFVTPPDRMLTCLQTYFERRRSVPSGPAPEQIADQIDGLCATLRAHLGHDFAGYKRSTIVRRVERRMHVLAIRSPKEYRQRVEQDAEERDALFRDLLINVTRFFRDEDYFDRLAAGFIDPLFRDADEDTAVRIWVPGCSSGEEAFSIAMLCAEAARRYASDRPVQIFATDIDEQMLQTARSGVYPNTAIADIPPDLRERYTVPHADEFAIASAIRDLVRLSNHSLTKDPPFSRLDLISCRNLLIYFDEALQQQVLPIFHYALKPSGALFLGPSESVGRFEHLFETVDGQARLFARAAGPPQYPLVLPGGTEEFARMPVREDRARPPVLADEQAAMRRLVDRYAPPGVLLDEDGNILATYGRIGRYFLFPDLRAGTASAAMLARPGLREVVEPLRRQAQELRKRCVTRDIEVVTDHGIQPVDAVCEALEGGRVLLVLRDAAPFQPLPEDDLEQVEYAGGEFESLQEDLRSTRQRLRAVVEELETANEELKSSNEEMMSMNEELQSTNEELATVNDELKVKVDQVTVANADLRNFFESTDLAVVVLDRDLKVRNFTEAATAIFPLQQADRGRPLADVTSVLDDDGYLADARRVLAGGPRLSRRARSRDGLQVWSIRVLPYRAQHGTVEGATLVLTEITEALRLEQQIADGRERLDLAIRAGGISVWEYAPADEVFTLDASGRELHGGAAESVTLAAFMDRVPVEDQATVREALDRAGRGKADFEATYRVRRAANEVRWIRAVGRREESAAQNLVGVAIDVTAEYRLAETRELMLREMNHRVKNLFAIVGGLISAASRSHTEVRPFAEEVRERIAALGRAHSLAAPTGEQKETDLGALVGATLAPYLDRRDVTLAGETVMVSPSCLSPLALILHEWATNAMKYGALGHESGVLRVSWHRDDKGVHLLWQESGVPHRAETHKAGFGSLLVDTSVRQLGATLDRQQGDDGLTLALMMSLPDEGDV